MAEEIEIDEMALPLRAGVDRAKLGKTNKRKGSAAERTYAQEFRDIGYKHCKTSRLGSKMLDACGIDLIFIPFNVQVKAGYAKGLNYGKELLYLTDRMNEILPETSLEHTYPRILIHRKDVGAGNKRTAESELVVMTFEDFKKLITKV